MITILSAVASFLIGFMAGSLYTINHAAIIRNVLEYVQRFILPLVR